MELACVVFEGWSCVEMQINKPNAIQCGPPPSYKLVQEPHELVVSFMNGGYGNYVHRLGYLGDPHCMIISWDSMK